MAEWVYLWLQKYHLHGIDSQEALGYIVEGTASRSDTALKLKLVVDALGTVTKGLSFSKSLKRKYSDNKNCHSSHAEVAQLDNAKRTTEKHLTLVNEIYEIDEQIELLSKHSGETQAKVQNAILSNIQQAADIEGFQDSSIDNSVVVWCSQAFMMPSSEDNSVHSTCKQLEEIGLSLNKSTDPYGIIGQIRKLQKEKLLRCVIYGGENTKGLGAILCDSSCYEVHTGKLCHMCNNLFESHVGHRCANGNQGRFSTEAKTDISSRCIVALRCLVKYYGLPPTRAFYIANSIKVTEDERMDLWNLGVEVVYNLKELAHMIKSISSWTKSSNNDIDETPMCLAESERSKIMDLRDKLKALEQEKLEAGATYETKRNALRLAAVEKYNHLESSVRSRVSELTIAVKDCESIITAFAKSHMLTEDFKTIPGPHSCRDAALAVAWLEENRTRLQSIVLSRLPLETLRIAFKDLLRHFSNMRDEITFLRRMLLASKVVAFVTSSLHKKMLNLCHGWLSTYLPHCLAKVNRVSFGLLTEADCKAAIAADPMVPPSRLKLAVPFLGKDVPSKSSEFAHPDVIIGLTILAYRYSGLRRSDFTDIVDTLCSHFSNEIGPPRGRQSSQRHESWIFAAGGRIRGLPTTKDGNAWVGIPFIKFIIYHRFVAQAVSDPKDDETKEVVQLKFLQRSNVDQMDRLFHLFEKEPLVIHDYLEKSIFPVYMRSQRLKISASGQAVGGDMLFGRRIGFSGTPSDLLPQELGRCDYETGDDGMMLSTVLDRAVVSEEHLEVTCAVTHTHNYYLTSERLEHRRYFGKSRKSRNASLSRSHRHWSPNNWVF